MSSSQWKKQHTGGVGAGPLLVRVPKLLIRNQHKQWAAVSPAFAACRIH